jgi:hypothetical protein
MRFSVALKMFALKAPHNPRLEATAAIEKAVTEVSSKY